MSDRPDSRPDWEPPEVPAGAVQCPLHGLVLLTRDEYERQLRVAGSPWTCPEPGCHRTSNWDVDAYEALERFRERTGG